MSRCVRVAIIGMGGIGGVLAALLQRAGHHNVVVCSRRPIDSIALDENDSTAHIAVKTISDPDEIVSGAHWVLLCTKAHDTESAAPWFSQLCRHGTHVVVLQNGIDQVSRVAPFVGQSIVVPSIVHFNGERIELGHMRFHHAVKDDVTVPDNAAGKAFVELLRGTSLKVEARPDFATLQWRKLLLNATANPITALTRQRLAVLRRDDIRALSLSLLEEAVTVARASGAEFGREEAETIFNSLLSYPAEVGTSMYFDCLNNRPMEIEALTGAIVSAGLKHNIPTPTNQIILTLLRSINDVPPSERV